MPKSHLTERLAVANARRPRRALMAWGLLVLLSLVLAGGVAIVGYLLTMVLPGPARLTLEAVLGEGEGHVLVVPATPPTGTATTATVRPNDAPARTW